MMNTSKYDIDPKYQIPTTKITKLNKSEIIVRNYEFDIEKNEISLIEKSPSSRVMGDISSNKSSNSLLACVICFQNQPNAVLMDCGHGG